MKNLLFSLFLTFISINTYSQNSGKITLKGVFWDDSTGIDLKTIVFCKENEKILKVIESGKDEKLNFELPSTASELVFNSKNFKEVKMPINVIGSIESNFEAAFGITTLGKFGHFTSDSFLYLNIPDFYIQGLKVELFWISDSQKRFMTDLTVLLKNSKFSSVGFPISNIDKEILIQFRTQEGETKFERKFTIKKGINFIDLNSKESELTNQNNIAIPIKMSAKEFGIRQLFFDQSSYDLRQFNKQVLDSLAVYLIENPNSKIMIKGFTDGIGDKKMNVALAEYRTKIVANYLFQKKIDENRVKLSWDGEKEVHKDSLEHYRKVSVQVY